MYSRNWVFEKFIQLMEGLVQIKLLCDLEPDLCLPSAILMILLYILSLNYPCIAVIQSLQR